MAKTVRSRARLNGFKPRALQACQGLLDFYCDYRHGRNTETYAIPVQLSAVETPRDNHLRLFKRVVRVHAAGGENTARKARRLQTFQARLDRTPAVWVAAQ